jgi:hypothetical protein
MAIPDMTASLTKLRPAWASRTNRTALLTGVILFITLLATYVASPIRTSEDSRWSIATTMSFIRGAGGDLSAYLPPSPDYAPAGYALRTHGDRTYTMYPIGASRRASLIQYSSLPLALSFVIRPTAGIPIAVFTAYVLICYRPWFWRYALWAACIAIPWIAYNILTWESILPPYYLLLASGSTPAAQPAFGEALIGNLFSPARGLFIFSPVLLLAICGFWLAMRIRDERALHMAFGIIVVLHWLLVSHFSPWWGGYSFGPRIMSDMLPFLAYFVAFTLQWCLAGRSRAHIAAIAGIAGLAAVSIFIHAQGALRWPPHVWNAFPSDIDTHPARLWDWKDLQFMRR